MDVCSFLGLTGLLKMLALKSRISAKGAVQ